MDKNNFDEILQKILPLIERRSTHAFPIPAISRLAIAIRYLATGNSQASLSFNFRISPSMISSILSETLSAICKDLRCFLPQQKKRLLWPLKSLKDNEISQTIAQFHSKVLFAATDANYRFVMVDIGQDGSSSDAGIFKTSPIRKFVDQGQKFLFPPKALKNGEVLPHVFLGDDAFQLQQHVMRPFPGKFIDKCCRVYNYRLSRARLVKNDWNGMKPDMEVEGELVPGNWRESVPAGTDFTSIGSIGSNNYSKPAFEVCEKFKDYFNSPAGSVKWQNKFAFKGYE
ncbi:hypothetical protein Fcan01_17755 [Folsomia candida]|uniref:DDE Tnp4 domain-containing protein n=1 Tax=Folsomia candida TaxID=158441 RepID=A0A226DR61_FOLCA|nr:hypothetical protein Fcan01_17755 [Folsomia candida]